MHLLCVLIHTVQHVMLCVIATTDSLAEAWELSQLLWPLVAEGVLLVPNFVTNKTCSVQCMTNMFPEY